MAKLGFWYGVGNQELVKGCFYTNGILFTIY